MAAVLCLKLENYAAAREYLVGAQRFIEEKAKAKGLTRMPPEYFEIVLYRGRTEDLLGNRAEASAIYRGLADRSDLEDANLRKIAEVGTPYTVKRLNRVVMPYSTYIPFE